MASSINWHGKTQTIRICRLGAFLVLRWFLVFRQLFGKVPAQGHCRNFRTLPGPLPRGFWRERVKVSAELIDMAAKVCFAACRVVLAGSSVALTGILGSAAECEPSGATQTPAPLGSGRANLAAVARGKADTHLETATAGEDAVIDSLGKQYRRLSSYSLPAGYEEEGGFVRVNVTRHFNKKEHFINSLMRVPGGLERHEHFVCAKRGELLMKLRLGEKMVGHPGLVHGGATATLLDDTFGMLFFCLRMGTGFTANLNIDYRAPLPAGREVQAHLKVTSVQGRKVHMTAVLFDPASGTVHAQARCLFIAKHVPASAAAVDQLQALLDSTLTVPVDAATQER